MPNNRFATVPELGRPQEGREIALAGAGDRLQWPMVDLFKRIPARPADVDRSVLHGLS